MNLRQFKDALEGLDPEMDVVVRLAEPDDLDRREMDEVVGAYAQVTDERSVSVEYGRLVIIGDLVDE